MEETNSNQPIIEKNNKTFKMYLIFWIGQLISLFGSSVVQFAGSWWITEQSANPIYMSLMMLFMFLPNILFGALAGVLADRYNKKVIIFLSDAYQALVTLGLILFAIFLSSSIWTFIIFMGIRYIGSAFQRPAVNTIIPLMVPDEKLSQINGLNSLLQALVQMVSPFIGALLVSKYSIFQIMWLDIITFIIGFIPLLIIKIPKVQKVSSLLKEANIEKKNSKSSYFQDFKEGMQTIKETPGLWVLITTAIFNNLLITPINVLTTYFILYDHGGDANTYAIVSIFITAGIIGGSILMSVKKTWKRKRFHFSIWHYIAFGGYALVGLAPFGQFWLISLGGFILLFSIPVINTFYLTYIQISVPKDKLGRVFSLDSVFSAIATPIGMILAAPLGMYLGIGNLFTICAFIAMGIISIFILTRQMHKIDFEKFEGVSESIELETTKETSIIME
ncbi:MFS transporter [Candidatus Lokiarchaeum ossiferum]|uniref:MFS transporter n=1 Tax=Candidatus Lokiarchaeum ossiferum TaxID=2951803 RepID=UPI00352CD759